MNKLESIKNYAQTLSLKNTYEQLEHLVHSAEQSSLSYVAFIEMIFKDEIKFKQDKAKAKRVKEAGFPYPKLLDDFDLNFCDSLSVKQFNQLKELTWIDGLYNLILSGPPGTGNYRKKNIIERNEF